MAQGHPGGALFHSAQESGALTLLISRSNFLGNSGSAVSAVGFYIVISATSFKDNFGGMQAGAIICESCVRLLLQACKIEGSVSNSPGWRHSDNWAISFWRPSGSSSCLK